MAEAIVAFAFAGNILQFLEAGGKFASRAYAITTAGSNSLADLQELRHITEYLQPILQQLSQENAKDAPPNQVRMLKLSKECSQLVAELLRTLDDAGVHDTGRRMDQVITAFKLTWHSSKIQRLKDQITKLRMQLAVDLLISIREHSRKSVDQQEAILQQLKNDRKYIVGTAVEGNAPRKDQGLAANAPGYVILEYLRTRNASSGSGREELHKLQDEIRRVLFARGTYLDYDNVYGQSYPRIEMDPKRREEVEAQVVASLHYREIEDRQSTIVEAYEKTLQWMFEDAPADRKDTKFREWLRSDDKLYWITGKAGSGKSTLMKYISRFDGNSKGSQQCKEHLAKWAGEEKSLVVASFYFWASGTSMEASQKGLFQSLLYQILLVHPELIPRVAPKVWEAWCLYGSPTNVYPEEDIHAMLYESIQELTAKEGAKVCLFIDGLDEYDGEHQTLINNCQGLLNLPNVKMCVSSRPWLVFEDAFHKSPNIMLQELTYPDIRHFVVSKFENNDGFKRLQLRETGFADTLMDNITEKSSGVFLWVQLVVNSLLAGLNHDDRISDLQRRLNLLPPDLERLYVTIVEDLDPFYFQHASQYFKLLQASDEPLDVLLYSFADEEDPNYSINLPIAPLSDEGIRIETVRRRLNSRCKGLLEVGPNRKVQYLHRSVKEYIDGNDVRLRIDTAAGDDFDCYLRLCSANLAMVKCTGLASTTPSDRLVFAKNCLKAATKVKRDTSAMIRVLDCLNQTMRQVESVQDLALFHKAVPDLDKLSPWLDHHYGTSFLAATVRFGVVNYVRARAEAGCLAADNNGDHDDLDEFPVGKIKLHKNKSSPVAMLKRLFRRKPKPPPTSPVRQQHEIGRRKGTWPLLLDANFCDPVSLPMFRCLLERGADPNLMFHRDGGTPWTEMLAKMLASCIWTTDGGGPAAVWAAWTPVVRLFLEHGVGLDAAAIKMAMARMHRAPTLFMDQERLGIALQCAATGREALGLEYLIGENDVSLFRKGEKGGFDGSGGYSP